MQQILLFIFLLTLNLPLRGQTILSIEPNPVQDTFSVNLSDDALDLEVYAKVVNNTNQAIELKWTRFELDKPFEWETQVCDNVLCYAPIVSSNIDTILGVDAPVIIEADTSMELIFHILPNGTAGTGKFDLDFALVDKPDSILETISYDITVLNTTSVSKLKRAQIIAFPNPATEYFELTNSEGVDQIILLDMVGRDVRRYYAYPGTRYSLQGIPDGIYLVSLINNEYGLFRTIRLGKRSYRP